MRIKINKLPWKVWKFTKLKYAIIIDIGYRAIWITWGKK